MYRFLQSSSFKKPTRTRGDFRCGSKINKAKLLNRESDATMRDKKSGFVRLPDSELKVMQVIWDMFAAGETVDAGSMMSAYPRALGHLKLTTVLTLISRLTDKGFVTVEKQGRTNIYTPLVGEDDYKRGAAADFIQNVYKNSPAHLMSALIGSGAISREDIDELRRQLTAE